MTLERLAEIRALTGQFMPGSARELLVELTNELMPRLIAEKTPHPVATWVLELEERVAHLEGEQRLHDLRITHIEVLGEYEGYDE